jgi:hypothetical protein
VLFLRHTTPSPGPTRDNSPRLRVFLSERQARALLGPPTRSDIGWPYNSQYWVGQGIKVQVDFDDRDNDLGEIASKEGPHGYVRGAASWGDSGQPEGPWTDQEPTLLDRLPGLLPW